MDNKNYFRNLLWTASAINILGKIKNTLANTKSPFAILKQFYNAGGIKGVLFGLDK